MTPSKSLITHINASGKYVIYIIAALIAMIWLLETPAGILGKADAVGYAVCHRIDVRSLHIGIRQLPLCARCTGQYLGAIIGLTFQGIAAKRRSGFPPKRVIAILCILFLAYAVDGVNSYLYLPPFLNAFPGMIHLYEPSNVLRLLTGTGMGLIIASILYPAFIGTIYSNPDKRPALAGNGTLLIMIASAFLVDMLLLTGSKYILYPAALVSAGSVIILLSIAYGTLVLLVLHKNNRITKLSEIISPLIIGFTVTMVQLALFDTIRFIITRTWSGLIF